MPVTEIKRPNYYEGQYLGAADMVAAQDYQRQQDQRHRLGGHTWGIAAGLELEERLQPGSSDVVDVYIKAGYGWDGFGSAIVVLEPKKVDESLFAQFTYDKNLPEGQWVPVWLRYNENETNLAAPGFAVCDAPDQASRILETARVVVGDLPFVSQQRDKISVASKSLDAAAEIPDGSVPYQALPDAGESARWLIRLGSVRWLAPNPPTTTTGHFVKSVTQQESETAREGRTYIGVVAETVLAPAAKIRMRDRFKAVIPANETIHLAAVEGSLRIDEDLHIRGKAGIGTLAPEQSLSVNAALNVDQANANNGTVNPGVTFGSASGEGIASKRTATGNQFGLDFYTASAARLAITNAGNVGIGTDAPTSKLHLNVPASSSPISAMSLDVQSFGTAANALASHCLRIRDIGAGPSTIFFIRGDGSVGIGTSNPSKRLGIRAIRSGEELLGFEDPTGATKWHINQNLGGNNPGLNFVETGVADGRLFIKAGGNVGIGTVTPQARLEVAGDLKVTGGNIFVDGHLIPVAVGVDVVTGLRVLNKSGGETGGNNYYGHDIFDVTSRLSSVTSASMMVALTSIGNLGLANEALWIVRVANISRSTDPNAPTTFSFDVYYQIGDSDGFLYQYMFVAIFVP